MNNVNEEKLVQVFAGNVWQAQLVKGLLDTNGIPCAINDETVGAVISQYAPNIGDVYVVVTEENKEKALKSRRIQIPKIPKRVATETLPPVLTLQSPPSVTHLRAYFPHHLVRTAAKVHYTIGSLSVEPLTVTFCHTSVA